MKRILLTTVFSVLLICSVFAYTDSFKSMTEDNDFIALMDIVKNGKSTKEAEAAYEIYTSKEISDVDRSRVEYHMVRYYVDMGMEDEALKHLEKEREAYASIPGTASDLERRTAEADLVAAEYYITGKMGTGMDSSKLTKNLYKDYPEEFYSAIQEAFRLLYTPPIAGGSSKKALKLINDVEANVQGISKLDNYSMLVAKAMALSKAGEYDESDDYLDRAVSIYTFDNAIDDIRKDNARGRR